MSFRHFSQFMNQSLHLLKCLIFQLIASKCSHHDPLIREVQFLLRANFLPHLIYIKGQAIHRDFICIYMLIENRHLLVYVEITLI